MKVHIGNYPNWFRCNWHERWLAWRYNKPSWKVKNREMDVWDRRIEKLDDVAQDILNATINRWCEWRGQKIKVKIDRWDVWSMDSTLAHIILPMLKKLKTDKQGAPCVDAEDVPDHLRPTAEELAAYKQNGATDDKFFERWDWVLDEMIFAFECLVNDSWEQLFHTGNVDFVSIPVDKDGNPVDEDDADYFEMKRGPNDTSKFDVDGHREFNARIDRGLTLFGKYFRALWT